MLEGNIQISMQLQILIKIYISHKENAEVACLLLILFMQVMVDIRYGVRSIK